MSEVVLSLDQALKTTGYAVFENETLIECGKFTINANATMGERLASFKKEILGLKESYNVDTIIFEQIQLQNGNAKTFQHLAYVQAMLFYFCYQHNIKHEVYEASHWRKVLGGGFGRKRAEQKQKAIDVVQQKYQIEVDSDIADAICIGCAYLKEKRNNQKGF